MKKQKVIQFIINVFTPILLGTLIGLVYKDDFNYVSSLKRVIKVPSILFPIIWSVLYLLQGLWYYFYLKKEKNTTVMYVYWISIVVNLLYTPVFFNLHLNYLSTLIVISLIVLIWYLFVYSIKKKYKIAYLYVPYLLWLIVALTLMIDILIHN